MTFGYTIKLGLKVQKITIRAHKIDHLFLEIYEIILAYF